MNAKGSSQNSGRVCLARGSPTLRRKLGVPRILRATNTATRARSSGEAVLSSPGASRATLVLDSRPRSREGARKFPLSPGRAAAPCEFLSAAFASFGGRYYGGGVTRFAFNTAPSLPRSVRSYALAEKYAAGYTPIFLRGTTTFRLPAETRRAARYGEREKRGTT